MIVVERKGTSIIITVERQDASIHRIGGRIRRDFPEADVRVYLPETVVMFFDDPYVAMSARADVDKLVACDPPPLKKDWPSI